MDQISELFTSPLGMLLVSAAMFAAGWLLFGADTRIEERRRRAIEFARRLSAIGFKKLPAIFEDYAVGDYSGMFRAMKELHDVMSDPAQRAAELENVFRLLLEEKFRDPAQKQALLKLIDDLKGATATGIDPLSLSGQLAKDVMEVVRGGTVGRALLPRAVEATRGNLVDAIVDRLVPAAKSGSATAATGLPVEIAPATPAV